MKSSITFLFCSLFAIVLITASALPGAPASKSLAVVTAPAQACPPVIPPIDPNKDFVGNFLNSCYAVQMTKGNGHASVGDLNATYNQMYYQILNGLLALPSGYSLIIFGVYPNTRFMSATAYDDHSVIVGQMFDNQILPLTTSMVNPLLPGSTYVPNQQYGITVNLGFPAPVTVTPGCSTADTTIDQNVMDASQIHSGLTWAGYPNLPPGFPPHQTGANAGGILEIRKYVDISNPPSTAVVIVRDLSTGCAVPASQTTNILAANQPNPTPWLHENQMSFHAQFSQDVLPKTCYTPDPLNFVTWFRTRDYAPVDNGANASVHASIPAGYVQALVAGRVFMRVQFQLPTHPTTPCFNGACSLTGNEDQRYKSLSLQSGQNTLISLKDSNFVTDPNGNVSLIVSLGAVPPPQVTPANYYTYVDLTQNPNYASLESLFVRDILPNPGFLCTSWNMPFKSMAYFPLLDGSSGGFMGTYNMTVDFPNAAGILPTPVPPARTNTCAVPPPVAPIACPVAPPEPIDLPVQ